MTEPALKQGLGQGRLKPVTNSRRCSYCYKVSVMGWPNAFVKSEKEMSSFEPMPVRDYLDVVDPCELCSDAPHRLDRCPPWEQCMRQRRFSLRRNEDHPVPVVRRVPIDKLSEEKDFACVFQVDGSETITWDKQTRLRVACDKCWSLAQCQRMKHTLDPKDIAFLDLDNAPGVTPAKRSCKSVSSPSGCSKTTPSRRANQASTSEGRGPKRTRVSPGTSPAAIRRVSLGLRPAVQLAASPTPTRPIRGSAARTNQNLSPSPSATSSASPGDGGGPSPPAERDGIGGESPTSGGVAECKGKGPARRQPAGASGADDPRSQSPDAAAGARVEAGGLEAPSMAPELQSAAEGNALYVEKLRSEVHLAKERVQKTTKHLNDLDQIKQHARAQIRDAERLLNSSEVNEQEVNARLTRLKEEENVAKDRLKDALRGSAEKLMAEAARLEREAQQLP